LFRQEKVTKEKATPNVAPSGHPALRVRSRATGFARCTSMYMSQTRAHRARDPSDFSSAREPRLTGPPKERRAPARRSNSNGHSHSHSNGHSHSHSHSHSHQVAALLLCFVHLLWCVCSFCAHDARCSSGPRRARRGRAGSGPQGHAHDARAFPNAHGCASGKPRSGLAYPQHRDCAKGATDRGALSLGYFSLGKQREVTRSPQGSGSLGSQGKKARAITGFQLSLE